MLALLSEVSDLNISATQTLAYDGFVMAKLIILLQEGSIKKHKLAKELSDLVNYCVSKRFKDFQVSQHGRKYLLHHHIVILFVKTF